VQNRNSTESAKFSAELNLEPLQMVQLNPCFDEMGRRHQRHVSAIHGHKIKPAEPRLIERVSQLNS